MSQCIVCGAEVTRGPRCRSCAQTARWEGTMVASIDADMLDEYTNKGLSYRAIGARHGVSHERARKRINRAIARLPELEQRRLHGDR